MHLADGPIIYFKIILHPLMLATLIVDLTITTQFAVTTTGSLDSRVYGC